MSVNFFLNDLQKRIDGSIQQAMNAAENAGISLEIEAGRQVALAIENAKLAYQDSLNLTMAKADKVVRDSLNTLSSMVQDFEQKSFDTIHDFEAKTSQWLMALPFTGNQPQLREVKPKYVVANGVDKKATIRFLGLFKNAANPLCKPSLEIDGKSYVPTSFTNQQVDFEISLTKALKNRCSYVKGTLKFPSEKNLGIEVTKAATYSVWLGILSERPGDITVHYTTTKVDKMTKHVISNTVKAWGDEHHPAKWVVKKETIRPESGWTIVPGSVRGPVSHKGAHGSHNQPSIASIDPHQIVTQVGLCASDGKHMGRVEYHVEFDQTQDVEVQDTRQEHVMLNWKDSVVVGPKNGEELYKISFDAFDGTHSEFAGADLDNPYLKIKFTNGKYQLSAPIPRE